ncbi:MAG: DUF2271 domain-containing protein [Sphingomonas fennica]
MRLRIRTALPAAAMGTFAAPAMAATIDVSVTLPQLKVAEYHRPYVAMWLEQPGQPAVRNVAVWYQTEKKREDGTKWLRDLRSWWRKAGRTATLPIAGVTGATRAPGVQKSSLNLGALPPGQYDLMVEAAREEGGREVVRVPIAWNGKAATRPASAAGTTELGAVSATIKP